MHALSRVFFTRRYTGALSLVCCGPGVTVPESTSGKHELDCCDACQAVGARRSVEYYTGFYHDYAKTRGFKVRASVAGPMGDDAQGQGRRARS